MGENRCWCPNLATLPERTVTVSAAIPFALLVVLDAQAEVAGKSRSELIRDCLVHGLPSSLPCVFGGCDDE